MTEYMVTGDDESYAVFDAPDDTAARKRMSEWWDGRRKGLDEYTMRLSKFDPMPEEVTEVTMEREPGTWRRKP